ncbi:MqnA/MqnD/SBP family protein [Cellulomonas sp.]|uniref:ABC transporter substrate-binding protein n=1 Tax=Cellulomonas sp. TaxID=40001 RepID=UPI001B1632D5|nr:MqnA/MqnD/SBP family protein [Cellulomonas sp.]MBO9556251.1 ABC transporter substrate-binding protein [Cellulomonas sp.]
MTVRPRLLVAALAVAALLSGCAGTAAGTAATPSPTTASPTATAAERTTFRIASLKGPTTMGLVELMDTATQGTARHDYQVTVYGTPDEVVPQVLHGDVDVAMVPSNLAAVLYAKTKATPAAVQVAAVNTLGVLQVVEVGETVHSLADLRGRTVYSSGKGTTPQLVLDHLLSENGLDPAADLHVEYLSEPTQVAAQLAADPSAVAVLPQPFVTVAEAQIPGARTALDLTDEWRKVTPGSELVMGVAVVRAAFAAEHPDAFAEFLDDYAASVEFTNAHPDDAGALIAAAGVVPAAKVATAAIPASHITYLDGSAMRDALEGYLDVLHDADPATVGGALPGDDFYYGVDG